MTAEEARAHLVRMVFPSMVPELDDATVDALLARARRPDGDCRVPSDPDWTPTYDLNAAAAEGWEMKAGMAAGDYDFAASGQRFDRSQVSAQCLKMAEVYSARSGGGSVAVSAGAVEQFVAATVEGLAPGGEPLR
jgi:hypothetical protein